MLRLCSDSSRSYPGRSVRVAVPDTWGCARHGNMPSTGQKSAEAIVGVDAVPMRLDGWKQAGEAPRKPYPAEGPNEE
jgi:hypothetical protein